MPLGWRECDNGHQYEVLILRGVAGAIDRDDGEDLCPECDQPGKVVFVSPDNTAPGQSAKYPYFDIGLGMWLHSASGHRRELKKRGMELVSPTEASRIHEEVWNRKRDADAKIDADMAELQTEYNTDPVIRPVYEQFQRQQRDAHELVAEAQRSVLEAQRSGDPRRVERAVGDLYDAKRTARDAMTAWWR